MSFVLIAPEFVTAAAGDLTNLGSSISAANASAASATTQVLAAGADEVSARIAALFGGFGLEYQAISAQVAAYHQRFVQALSTGAGAYASAEAAAAEQIVLGVINAPTQALLGRPLIGNGADGAPGTGQAGGAGGILYGNGGNGGSGGAGQADLVVLLHALIDQVVREAVGLILQLGVGQLLIAADNGDTVRHGVDGVLGEIGNIQGHGHQTRTCYIS
ncbi:PE-PGRS family protein [Mycobacterium tuberculosis]|nr:PE-PGRS family protein [Mycobacterium tuberculosis]